MSYLAGPIRASSSWVESFGFFADDDKSRGIKKWLGIGIEKGIIITFRDGARCFYPGTTEREFRSLAAAPSKGKWVHKNVYTRRYILV